MIDNAASSAASRLFAAARWMYLQARLALERWLERWAA